MDIKAAIVRKNFEDFEMANLQLADITPDEVRVKIVATGVCHTDAMIRDGGYPTPTPVVLGHEGAGIVEEVGANVTHVKPGDKVVLGFSSCGKCTQCLAGRPAYCLNFFDFNFAGQRPDGTASISEDGERVASHFFGQSSFSTYVNAWGRSVVRVPDETPVELLGPLGCGMMTGAGAIMNSLAVKAGDTVGIFGTGAVGCAAIMAAAAVGATTVIAIDIVDSRLELAKEIGATHTINSKTENVAERVAEITGGLGLGYTLDTTGVPPVTKTAVEVLAIKGKAGLVGAPKPGTEVPFEVGESLMKGWSFQTIIEGDAVPQDFVPRLVNLWQQGKFPFDKLTRTYKFEDINQAFDDSKSGEVIKPILKIAE